MSGNANEGSGTAASREVLAIALGWATIVTLFAAALVWSAPPLRTPDATPPVDRGSGGNPSGIPTAEDGGLRNLFVHFPLPFTRWYDDLVFT